MTRLINIDNGGTLTDFCLDTGGEALSRELLAQVNDLSARGARRPVIAVSADGEARVRGLLLRPSPSSARHGPAAVLLGTGRQPPTTSAAPGRVCSTRFLHPAMQRFLFNAGRRLPDAPARQLSRIFRRRLTACSPVPARPDPKP